MSKTVRATDAARHFSDLLNTIKFRGETFTIIRGGKSVASIGPVEGTQKSRTLGELKRLLQSLPRLGEEAERFTDDLKEIIQHQPSLPKEI